VSSDYVRVMFTDLLGLAHGKVVPIAKLHEPFHCAITVLNQGLDLSLIDVDGYGVDVGFPDLEAVVDPTSLRDGWEPGIGVALASLRFPETGAPIPLDARGALARIAGELAERELVARVGFEAELYLLERPGSDLPVTPLAVPGHRVYGTGRGADPSGLVMDIVRAAGACGIGIEGANAEFHAAQVEIPTSHRDAVGAADELFLLRELCRDLAEQRGAGITFMARPFPDRVGNGLHVNVSLQDASGRNVMADSSTDDGLSATARHAIGGLLAHHEGLTALCAPTVNSYRRLRPGLLSGYWANWGLDNRLSTVRVPAARGDATRIEHRMADGSASPHLALAAQLAAMMDGIERGLEPGPVQTGDADAAPVTDRHVPHTLADALDALDADKALVTLLGETLVEAFAKLKRAEWERWSDAVTDWELREYGRVH
jgi:glutamine synthetase